MKLRVFHTMLVDLEHPDPADIHGKIEGSKISFT